MKAESNTQGCEGRSGQSSRAERETNEVEPRGRTDGCANNNKNEFEQQQQWRRSENRQLRRWQRIQQGGEQEEGRR